MSYEIAATGLNAVNEQLDGISNNIANSGTVGYKSMTTQFSAMYAGTQAMGVSVAGSAQSISTGGSMVSTGNALDLAINDDGFFVMLRQRREHLLYPRGFLRDGQKRLYRQCVRRLPAGLSG
ncbi:flagellar hook protein [Citrobacter braakii]|nr:flagellar hook protein [Citrobacter braakii]